MSVEPPPRAGTRPVNDPTPGPVLSRRRR